jgi:hypothetical protein
MVKYKQLINRLKSNGNNETLLYYFGQTRKELEAILAAAGLQGISIMDANEFSTELTKSLILVEIHPLASVTDKLLTKLHPKTSIDCYIGMDEVLMKLFGSERIMGLMEKMGMKPDEAISHSMVTKSIEKAQIKLNQKLPYPKDVRDSSEKWAAENGVDQMAI